jgi:hypothetical protein
VTWNGAEPCELGDELITRTGRRYLVLGIKGKQFSCMVLPPDAKVESSQWLLTWNSRSKKEARE